jgi:hypothetical protein
VKPPRTGGMFWTSISVVAVEVAAAVERRVDREARGARLEGAADPHAVAAETRGVADASLALEGPVADEARFVAAEVPRAGSRSTSSPAVRFHRRTSAIAPANLRARLPGWAPIVLLARAASTSDPPVATLVHMPSR